MAFCQNCGKELNNGAKLCEGCGQTVERVQATETVVEEETENVILKEYLT